MKVEIPMELVTQIRCKNQVMTFSFLSTTISIFVSLSLTLSHSLSRINSMKKFARWVNRQRSESAAEQTNRMPSNYTIISKDSKRGETKNFKMRFPSPNIENIIKFSKPHFQHFTFFIPLNAGRILSHTHSLPRLPAPFHFFTLFNIDSPRVFAHFLHYRKMILISQIQTRQFHLDLVTSLPWCVCIYVCVTWLLLSPHVWNNVSKIKKSLLFRKFLYFASF